jgi:hypothetical protein
MGKQNHQHEKHPRKQQGGDPMPREQRKGVRPDDPRKERGQRDGAPFGESEDEDDARARERQDDEEIARDRFDR